jgi:hypothetical protein
MVSFGTVAGWAGLAAACGLALLSACTVVVEEEPLRPAPQFCTREYDPVCARRGGDLRTFANGCLADRAGFRIVRRGECRMVEERPRFCTQDYRPVCAVDRGRFRTFGNACEADAAGWRVIRNRAC